MIECYSFQSSEKCHASLHHAITVYWRATESLNSPGVNWDTIWKEIALSSEILAAHPSISMLFWAGHFESLRGTPKSFNFASLDFSELCNSEASESLCERVSGFRAALWLSKIFRRGPSFGSLRSQHRANFFRIEQGSQYLRVIQSSATFLRRRDEIETEGATLNACDGNAGRASSSGGDPKLMADIILASNLPLVNKIHWISVTRESQLAMSHIYDWGLWV